MTTDSERGTQAVRRIDPEMAKSTLVAVRLDDALLARINKHRERLLRIAGVRATQSSAIKSLIEHSTAKR